MRLGAAFARAGWHVAAVASRDETKRSRFAGLVPGAARLRGATGSARRRGPHLSDRSRRCRSEVAAQLHLYSGQALVHTSGALPASILAPAMAAGTNAGSFHPLVAFADHDQALADLHGRDRRRRGRRGRPAGPGRARRIDWRPPGALPEGGKTAYHAAAMMAAGGLVGLLDAIASVGKLAGLDERTAIAVYAPLARQALANAERLGIDGALTGPLLRGDVGTVESHLPVLEEQAPDAVPLYVEVARRAEPAIARRRGELGDEQAAQIAALLAHVFLAQRVARSSPLRPGRKPLPFDEDAQQLRPHPGRPPDHPFRRADRTAARATPWSAPHDAHPPGTGARRHARRDSHGRHPVRCARPSRSGAGGLEATIPPNQFHDLVVRSVHPSAPGTPAQRRSVARLTKQGRQDRTPSAGRAPPEQRRVAESSSATTESGPESCLGRRRRERDG